MFRKMSLCGGCGAACFALWLQALPEEWLDVGQGPHVREDENPKPEPVPSHSGNVRCGKQ